LDLQSADNLENHLVVQLDGMKVEWLVVMLAQRTVAVSVGEWADNSVALWGLLLVGKMDRMKALRLVVNWELLKAV
jgi:hypothetical protein